MSRQSESGDFTQNIDQDENRVSGSLAPWVLPLLLFLLVFVTFSPVLSNDFVNWDDNYNFLRNPHFRGVGAESLKWMLTTNLGNVYQPLGWLFCAVLYVVGGLSPTVWHLAGVVLHGVNSVLVFVVGIRILVIAKPGAGDGAFSPARLGMAAATGLYAIHPLRVEPVAWASALPYLLALFFALLSILSYLRHAEKPAGSARCLFLGLSLVAFACSLLSKSIAVTLPLVLVVMDIYPLQRLKTDKERLLSPGNLEILGEKVAFLLLGGLGAMAALWAEWTSDVGAGPADWSLPDRALAALHGIGFHLYKSLVPIRLVARYRIPSDPQAIYGQLLFGAILGVGITIFALILRKRLPSLLAAWGSYLALILPYLQTFQHGRQLGADRYTYLSTIPLFILLGAELRRLFERSGRKKRTLSLAALLLLTVALLSGKSWHRTHVWRNSVALAKDSLSKDPADAASWLNLGSAYHERGQYDKSNRAYQRALHLKPHYTPIWHGMGNNHRRLGDYEKAFRCYRKALEFDPDHAPSLSSLGSLYARGGQLEKAEDYLRKVEQLQPESAETYYNLGVIHALLGEAESARRYYRRCVQLNPRHSSAWYNLGNMDLAQEDVTGAARCYEKALRIQPGHVKARTNLANLYRMGGKLKIAAEHYRRALQTDPNHFTAVYGLGDVNERLGRHRRAAELFERAMRLESDRAEPYLRLGRVRERQGHEADAARLYREALKRNPDLREARRRLEAVQKND